jgi:hypothetical protein
MGDQKIYELELAQYVQHKAKLESKSKKVYALIMRQCTDLMMSRLKELP